MADWGQSYGGKDYPIIKTVYAGGIGTVRGYEGSSLGARDPVTGDYLGGTRRVVANAQLYLPFPGASKDRTLRWFLFTDAGQVSAGSGLSCTTGKSSSPWKILAAGVSRRVSACRGNRRWVRCSCPMRDRSTPSRATTSRHSSSRSEPVSKLSGYA